MTNINDSLKFELKKNPFFDGFDDSAFADLLALATPMHFKARSQIFQQGDPGDFMLILQSGKAKVSTFSNAGKETVLAFLTAGDLIGEIAVLDGDARTATAIVLEETRGLQITRAHFLPFLEAHPKIALKIIALICKRLRQADLFVEEVTTMQAGPRLARALLRLADSHGKEEDSGSVKIEMKLSQANLGAHAGLMRENVNRQLKAWEDEGILSSEAGFITLLQPETLADYVEAVD